MIENLGDPDGILIADPTGFAKKGTKVGRGATAVLRNPRPDRQLPDRTFLAFVNTAWANRVLIDRELYIPEKTWFGDRARCAEAAIPADLEFATRPAQVIAMITRSVQAGLEFRWFTADEEFGQNPGLRDYLEDATTTAYVMAIPQNTEFTDASVTTTEIKNWPPRLSPNAWQRRACGIGTRYWVYDWAVINSDRPDHQYMIRHAIRLLR